VKAIVTVGLVAMLWPGLVLAQAPHHHAAHADTTAKPPTMQGEHSHDAMSHAGMHHGMHMMAMTGMYGPYPMTREASGTAWQPDAGAHGGVHVMRGEWSLMLHGFADAVYDHQGGDRGDEKFFSDNMGMAMAQRPAGPGTLGLRAMLSVEPATIGQEGYPLLLQTGETADGVTPLIDRQHPHDLFMELAGTYRVASADRALFLYAGLPGEPALGPPAFMHRFSGRNIPVAPITHHWLDSTHITYGVLTAGAVVDRVKVEASGFRGREPDHERWNIESPKLDSWSVRLSVNPTDHWALQVSHGRLESVEQLEPDVDQDRTTVSAMYDGAWGEHGRWEATLAWGRNLSRPGQAHDGVLAEAAAAIAERHTVFTRVERVEKDELFIAPDPRAGEAFTVGELTAGYRWDAVRRGALALGVGLAGTLTFVPHELRDAYGERPASALIFVRAGVE
jgi:hypothetical protein